MNYVTYENLEYFGAQFFLKANSRNPIISHLTSQKQCMLTPQTYVSTGGKNKYLGYNGKAVKPPQGSQHGHSACQSLSPGQLLGL